MKLRNKKTGEIIETDFDLSISIPDDAKLYGCNTYTQLKGYGSLAELNEEWEDAPEEPKAGYIIDPMEEDCICDAKFGVDLECIERAKELGIWFETEEETEKTVEKLKAWTRLINHGLCLKLNKFQDLIEYKFKTGCISSDYDAEEALKDIDLLFGGEE